MGNLQLFRKQSKLKLLIFELSTLMINSKQKNLKAKKQQKWCDISRKTNFTKLTLNSHFFSMTCVLRSYNVLITCFHKFFHIFFTNTYFFSSSEFKVAFLIKQSFITAFFVCFDLNWKKFK